MGKPACYQRASPWYRRASLYLFPFSPVSRFPSYPFPLSFSPTSPGTAHIRWHRDYKHFGSSGASAFSRGPMVALRFRGEWLTTITALRVAEPDRCENSKHNKKRESDELRDQEWWFGLRGSQRLQCGHFLKRLRNQDEEI